MMMMHSLRAALRRVPGRLTRALTTGAPRPFARSRRPRRIAALPLVASLGLLAVASCAAGDDVDGDQQREDLVHAQMADLAGDAAGLQAFLRKMPKGGDLHSHTSGAITTEKLLQWGAEDGACVHPTTMVASNPCAAGSVSLSTAPPGSPLYLQAMGAWSMEGFTGPLLDAHQHFFDAFGKYGAIQLASRGDDIYADVLDSAGANHQLYVELLQGFGSGTGSTIAAGVFQPDDAWDRDTLLMRRQQILADPRFAPALAAQAATIAEQLAGARDVMGCETATPSPGCGVEVRLQVSANRTGTRVAVFGQWVFAYELAQLVPEVVGVNLVSPEEHPNSLAYYDDEMRALGILDAFNDETPGRKPVHVSLHAGELIPEVVPDPVHLTFHIRNAVELARAERIGHGVDVLGETAGAGPEALLATMRELGVMVEICLTSNRVLLDAAGARHPLARYREVGVPVALATDDQGILRGDISDEYLAAVRDQGLGYKELKGMVRTSLQHAFVEGESLWSADALAAATAAGAAPAAAFGEEVLVADCQGEALGGERPASACATFLQANKRAALQWKLEAQLADFEQAVSLDGAAALR